MKHVNVKVLALCLAVSMIGLALIATGSTPGYQIIGSGELATIAGAGSDLCKTSGPSCGACQKTGTNTSKKCTKAFSTKECTSGPLEKACDMSGSVNCGTTTYYYDNNEDCAGTNDRVTSDVTCTHATASGDDC